MCEVDEEDIRKIQQIIDFGRLKDDKYLISDIGAIHFATDEIRRLLESFCDGDYFKLSSEDKVHHDLFLSYALTSLFWVYLKAMGVNLEGHVVESELDRIKEYSQRFKSIKARRSMPRVDKAAANRFVKHGLWDPEDNPMKKATKRKRVDDEEDSES